MLSKIAQMFDPLGLIAAVLVIGKIIMQQLWKQELDWDEELPFKLKTTWEDYYSSLLHLRDIRIQRNVNIGNQSSTFDVYGFGDASEKAFGACLYAVSTNKNGNKQSALICSKSKVASLKTILLPRLELEAALLLTQLYDIVKKACGNKINNVKLWSDSTIVLGWIRTEPHLLKTFVANRVSKIQNLTEEVLWLHVSSEDNPADILSRGTSVESLINNKLWWTGPCWLKERHQYPSSMKDAKIELPKLK